jgi:hypothetical protein
MRVGRIALPLFATLVGFAATARAQSRPAMPIELPGCTVECCSYGTWVATSRAIARRRARSSSETAFVVSRGDTVTALTGHVTVTSPGIVVFTGRATIEAYEMAQGAPKESRLHMRAGDSLFVIMINAEATDAVLWRRGRTYVLGSGVEVFGIHVATPEAPYNVVSLPRLDWWARVRDRNGRLGWLRNPTRFAGTNDCR